MLQDNKKSTCTTLSVYMTCQVESESTFLPMQTDLMQGSVLQVHAKQTPEAPGGTNLGI